MTLPKSEKAPAAASQIHYNVNVNNNYGGIQQGGQGLSQNIEQQVKADEED
jgi:hypothetical protein